MEVLTFHEGGATVAEGFNPDVGDPRIVKMICPFEAAFVEDWIEDVTYGSGLWGVADEAIIGRRREREGGRTKERSSTY